MTNEQLAKEAAINWSLEKNDTNAEEFLKACLSGSYKEEMSK